MRFSTLQMQMFSYLCIAMFINTSLALKVVMISVGISSFPTLLALAPNAVQIPPSPLPAIAAHFLQSMERNQLFDILDARVLKEGKREEIEVMAELARRCLHFNGKRRPTMMEVATTLETVQTSKAGSSLVQNRNNRREWNAVEVADAVEVVDAESYDFTSSMSESMQFDTISPHLPSICPLIA